MQLFDILQLFFLSSNCPPKLITGEADRWIHSINVATVIVGSYFILDSFFPETMAVKRTKDTVGINKRMFILHTFVAFAFLMGAICWLADNIVLLYDENIKNKREPWLVAGLAQSIIFVLLNIPCFLGDIYILVLKFQQSAAAQRLGISEFDYYRDYVAKEAGIQVEESH